MASDLLSDKYLPGRILRLPLKLIPHDAELPILLGKLKGKKWIAGSGNHGYWIGSYEYEKRRLFESNVRAGAVIFDIGAHVGFYTLLASVLVGRNGKVFAFEPLPRNLEYLYRHLQINGIENVHVVEAAVSDSSGTSQFEEGRDSSTGRLERHGTLRVRTVCMDERMRSGEVCPPDCIKIDVEGGELGVLRGCRSILARYRPTVFLATHGVELYRQCCGLLASMKYHLRPVGKGSFDEVVATPMDSGKASHR
jgi:FkbM family methyltransferase